MFRKIGFWSVRSILLLCLLSVKAYSFPVTYKLESNRSLVLTNTLNSSISAYCLINAVANVTSSISISMLRGAILFNGTTIKQGQTLYQNIYNTQYIPITANGTANAQVTNIGTYAVQAQCSLS